MGTLKLVVAGGALLVAGSAQAGTVERWRPIVAEASVRFGVPVDWIERVIRVESDGLTELGGQPITSPAGAMGLMQLMPATWDAMRLQLRLGADPYEPRDNILAGTAFLRLLYNRFGYPGLFAAYSAGAARYHDFVKARRPLPAETRAYLASVIPSAPSPAPTMIVERRREALFAIDDGRRPPAALFVPLSGAGGEGKGFP